MSAPSAQLEGQLLELEGAVAELGGALEVEGQRPAARMSNPDALDRPQQLGLVVDRQLAHLLDHPGAVDEVDQAAAEVEDGAVVERGSMPCSWL